MIKVTAIFDNIYHRILITRMVSCYKNVFTSRFTYCCNNYVLLAEPFQPFWNK